MNTEDLKTCFGCREAKPTSEYHKSSGNKDGLATYCKPCKSAKDKEYRLLNVEALKIKKKAYYEANKETIRAKERAYRQTPEGKAKKAAMDKAYYEANKEKITEYKKQWYNDNFDRLQAKGAQYRKDNADRIREWDRSYKERNGERLKQYRYDKYWSDPETSRAIAKERREALIAKSPCYIYAVLCVPEERYYIGQTKFLRSRWQGHRQSFRNDCNPCGTGREMQEDYNRYGEEAFEYMILKELAADASEEDRIEEEGKMILQFIAEGKAIYNSKLPQEARQLLNT
jgi:hypothetical protein